MPALIATVHSVLTKLGLADDGGTRADELKPPVSIRKSITPDYLISMEDGGKYKTLKRHLSGRGLTPTSTAPSGACRPTIRWWRRSMRHFDDHSGAGILTPLTHLRQLRLEAVHAELSNPNGTQPVATVAVKWEFTHIGRFSAEYRAVFGEFHSTTANNLRRR